MEEAAAKQEQWVRTYQEQRRRAVRRLCRELQRRSQELRVRFAAAAERSEALRSQGCRAGKDRSPLRRSPQAPVALKDLAAAESGAQELTKNYISK